MILDKIHSDMDVQIQRITERAELAESIERDLQEEIECLREENAKLRDEMCNIKTSSIDDIKWGDLTQEKRRRLVNNCNEVEIIDLIRFNLYGHSGDQVSKLKRLKEFTERRLELESNKEANHE